jgi:sugar phosphate isomerase/epimerase
VHPPFRWQREYARGFAIGVAELESEFGVQVAVENMFPWRARGRELMAYLPHWDPVGQPYEHVTLDVSHTATAGVDPLEMAEALGERLVHLHLADGSGSAKDEHLVPGRGSQPCAELLERLAAKDWAGNVVVEVSTRRAVDLAEREVDLAEALAFARLNLVAAAR